MLRLATLAASAVAGTCWLVALFLPWTTDGALSSASLIDVVELVRRGAIDAIVPAGSVVVLLVPAVAGILLIGVAGLAGRTVALVRAGSLVVGVLASVILGWRLTDADLASAGPGAWVALAGVLLACQALGCAVYAVGADRLRRPGA